MKVTYNWIKDYVEIPWKPEDTAERLTMAGFEVEEIITIEPYIAGVINAKVLRVKPHPGSEKLKICTVDIGTGEKTIVCGAPNVYEGMNVPVALPETTLLNNEKIQVSRVLGVESYGMICSEYELGISDISDVIIEINDKSESGSRFHSEKFKKDWIFDLSITPNRPDCLGVIGIAREIAALSGQQIRKPETAISETNNIGDNFRIEILDAVKCPRYSARIIEGIKVKPSPVWMVNRLNAVGLRAINNIVDATNYVLMEIGQPMHAFDYNLIAGNKIIVKCAKNNQEFNTLDNVKRTLDSNSLLICDAERGIALAGIMGGLNSEVEENTTSVLLESAMFDPPNIRQTSKKIGLSTEASKRFERGPDPEITIYAIDRVCQLIMENSENILISRVYDNYPGNKGKKSIAFRPERANQVLGTHFSEKEMLEVLTSLEIAVKRDRGKIEVIPPSFRHDLEREIDLIEEVSRILGFDRIDEKITFFASSETEINEQDRYYDQFRNLLIGMGFNEVLTYSMIDEKYNEYFENPEDSLYLKNPISKEICLMRRSLIPGLLNVTQLNINKSFHDIRIFEIGKIYKKNSSDKNSIDEETCISAIIEGKTEKPMWQHKETNIDIFFLKGIIETLLDKIFLDNYEIIHYDRTDLEVSFCIKINNELSGFFGTFKNGCYGFEFDKNLFIFELFIDEIVKNIKKEVKYKPLKIFPSVFRDIAVVVDYTIQASQLDQCIIKNGGDFLKNVTIFDVYKGKQISNDKKSIGFSLEFYSTEKTLEEIEIEPIFKNIIKALTKEFDAKLRE